MKITTIQTNNLPFKCRMVCVSLICGSLILILIWSLKYIGFISMEAAVWASMVVFSAAAIYESFLLSSITKHMINSISK